MLPKTTIQTLPLPILNSPRMESGNISALKQLMLLLSYIEENTICVFYLQEDKGEFLWQLNDNFARLGIAVAGCLQPTANQAGANQAQVWSPKCPTREGSVDAQMTRLWWCSPAALLLPSIPLGQGCSRHDLCRKNTFGECMGREVLSQNIYIHTVPAAEALFISKVPLYVTGWTIKWGSTPSWSYSYIGMR